MSDNGDISHGSAAAAWKDLLSRPEVDHVEMVGDVVRVRLKSGVELEWTLDASDDLP